jgi:hypothetical protein
MRSEIRGVARFLAVAALLAAGCLLTPAVARAQGVGGVAHVDGYVSVSPNGRCMAVRQHDGALLTLYGSRRGLINNDHVRLEGRLVAGHACGGNGGFEITTVQTLWGDDNHRSTLYDHLRNGEFRRWVEHNRPDEVRHNDRDWDHDWDRPHR